MLTIIPILIAALIWHFRHVTTVSSCQYLPRERCGRFSQNAVAFCLMAAAAALALAAASNPAVWLTCQTRTQPAMNLALVLDMSGSMEASDWPENIRPNEKTNEQDIPRTRIENAKLQLRGLLANCPGARVALLAFADNTVLVSPLSKQRTTLLERLDTIRTEHLTDGTAIGKAILAAVRSLQCAPDGPRAIVILSDGVDHEGGSLTPEQAARQAAQKNIVIHAVGIGGPNAFHPVNSDQGIRWENVGEPMDLQQLQDICRIAGGKAFPAKDNDALADALADIQTHMAQQSRTFQAPRQIRLAPALMLLAAILVCAALALAPHTSHATKTP